MPESDRIRIAGRVFEVVPDGPVSRGDYWCETNPLRVVHLLKEVTMGVDEGGGLQEALLRLIKPNGGAKYRLWNVTARRSFALQNALPAWDALDPSGYGHAFRQAAVMNLNDTIPVGTKRRPRSSNKTLEELAKVRWACRRDQILALRPSIVVCGGVGPMVRRLLRSEGEVFEQGDGFFHWRGIPFVEAYHPSFSNKKHQREYEEMFSPRCRRAL